MMETKGGKKKSSSSSSSSNSVQYEVPLGYSIEDVRPNGGIEKFRSAAYSNVCIIHNSQPKYHAHKLIFCLKFFSFDKFVIRFLLLWVCLQCVRMPS